MDLETQDPVLYEAFLEHLRFHVQYMSGLLQKAPEEDALGRQMQAIHSQWLEMLDRHRKHFYSRNPEVIQQRQKDREFWEQVYKSFDSDS